MTARQQPIGANYVIRFERGSRYSPSLAGKFLGWDKCVFRGIVTADFAEA